MSVEFRHADVPLADGTLHVVESGDPAASAVLFLHGWPESWQTWQQVMRLAATEARAVAVDLPGVGGSTATAPDGRKSAIAARIGELIDVLGLADVTLVGHDVGGMVAYACLRRRPEPARVVIMDTVVPGLGPWQEVLANPHIWHFALHSVPELPETLVRGRQAAYFDYFYDVLSQDPSKLTAESRAAHVAAYRADGALSTGFGWYRGFERDAEENAAETAPVATPLLYLRGEAEGGDLDAYAAGFRAVGLSDVRSASVAGAGHFAPEEAPAEVWRLVRDFVGGRAG